MDLHWHKDQSIGDPRIDLIHQMHFELINEMSAAIGAGAGKERCIKQFDEFAQFVRFHSTAEENVMRDTNYGECESHKDAHNYGLEMIKSGVVNLRNGTISASELLDRICNWYLMHILLDDKKFGSHLRLLIEEFQKEFGDTADNSKTGLLAFEYIWQKFRNDAPTSYTLCLQKHIIEFLLNRSSEFRKKYSNQCKQWFDAHAEVEVKNEPCSTCKMRPFCADVKPQLN